MGPAHSVFSTLNFSRFPWENQTARWIREASLNYSSSPGLTRQQLEWGYLDLCCQNWWRKFKLPRLGLVPPRTGVQILAAPPSCTGPSTGLPSPHFPHQFPSALPNVPYCLSLASLNWCWRAWKSVQRGCIYTHWIRANVFIDTLNPLLSLPSSRSCLRELSILLLIRRFCHDFEGRRGYFERWEDRNVLWDDLQLDGQIAGRMPLSSTKQQQFKATKFKAAVWGIEREWTLLVFMTC